MWPMRIHLTMYRFILCLSVIYSAIVWCTTEHSVF